MTTAVGLQSMDVLRNHGRSFYFASRLLGHVHRERAARLYAFCRHIDDLVDMAQQPEQARLSLAAIRRSIDTSVSHHHAVTDMLALCKEIPLAAAPVMLLLEGVESDLAMQQFQDEAELIQYAYKVAGTVGLMMCAVLDVKDPQALPFAVDLGIAMQLTNIARDVGEDAANGRVYLPASWVGSLEPHNIRNPNSQYQALMQGGVAKLIALSDAYYKSGMRGIGYLPRSARYGIVVAAMLYREIGYVVQEHNYRSWAFRATVPLARKWVCASQALFRYAIDSSRHSSAPCHDPSLHRHLAGFLGTSGAM